MTTVPGAADAASVPVDGAAGTTGGSVLRGTAWNALAALLPPLFVVAVSVTAARLLGPTVMGRLSFISFVQLSVITLAASGVSVALMRTVAAATGEGDTAAVRGLVRWATRLMAGVGLLAGLAVASGGLVSDHDQTAWALAGVTTAVSVLETVPSALLIGLQRWRQAATAGVVTGGLSAAAVVVLLHRGGGLVSVFAVEAVVTAAALVWTSRLARRALDQVSGAAAPPGALVTRTIGLARPATLLALLDVLVWRRSEFFFLARYSPSAELAMYSVAFAAATAVTQIPTAVTAIASSFASLHGAGETRRLNQGFLRACRLMVTLTLPLMAGTLALESALVRTLYGSEYDRAGTVLTVLVLSLPLLPLFGLADALLLGRGEMAAQVRWTAAAVPVNLLLALTLVPRYGAVGAAVANVCAQVAAGTPLLVRCFRSVGARWADAGLSHLLRSAVIATVAGITARVVDDVVGGYPGLFVGAAAFAAVWVPAAALLRVLSADDGRWLATALQGRIGRPAGAAVRLVSSRAPAAV